MSQTIYVIYRTAFDADCEEWQQFEGAYSTKEKAEIAMAIKKEKSRDWWNRTAEFEIEEDILDEEEKV